MPAGKELDSETGLYYFGARYLDPKTGRWLSGDPAISEYVPSAPVSDEARKRNGSLPGMGGVFNVVNLHVYHYAGNNPVKYTDPAGRKVKYESGELDIYVKYEDPAVDPSKPNNDEIDGEMLSPGDTYPKEGDKRVDGVITYNSETGEIIIYKINDSKKSPFAPVSFSVKQEENGSYTFKMSWWNTFKNWIGGFFKKPGEVKAREYDLDKLPEGHPLRSWYGTAREQQAAVEGWEKERERKANEVQE